MKGIQIFRRSEGIIGSITESIRGEVPVKNRRGYKGKFLKKTIGDEDNRERYLEG